MSTQPTSFNLEIDEKLAEKIKDTLNEEGLMHVAVHAREVISNGTEENSEF